MKNKIIIYIACCLCIANVASSAQALQTVSPNLRVSVESLLGEMDTVQFMTPQLQKRANGLMDELRQVGAYDQAQRIEKRLKQFVPSTQQEQKETSAELLPETENTPEESKSNEPSPSINGDESDSGEEDNVNTPLSGVRKFVDEVFLRFPFDMAVRFGYTRIVKNFIRLGINVNAHDGEALRIAVAVRNPEIIKILLDAGADINQQDPLPLNNTTPLMEAARHGYFDIVKLLFDSGANINSATKQGLTVEDYAQIGPRDTTEERAEKKKIQALIARYKAKQLLPPLLARQAQQYTAKKAIARSARRGLETYLESTGQAETTQSVAKDVSAHIDPYCFKQYQLPKDKDI